MPIDSEEISSSQTAFSQVVYQIIMALPNFLPGYMIPSAYIPIQSLPFSNSYKLDRRALNERANSLPISAIQETTSSKECKHQDRPLTEREDKLRSLWTELLHLPPESVRIHQDFFSSGGGSLKAMALMSAARRKGINFSVAQLYQLRHIGELSKFAGEEAVEEPQTASFSLIDIAMSDNFWRWQLNSAASRLKLSKISYLFLTCSAFTWIVNDANLVPGKYPSHLIYLWALVVEDFNEHGKKCLKQYLITRTRFIDTSYGIFQVILMHENIQWKSETSLTKLLDAWETEDMSFRHRTHQSALLRQTTKRRRVSCGM